MTVGRAILNDHLPEGMPYINGLLQKKGIGQLGPARLLRFGLEVTVKMLDEVKDLGFRYATKSGLSIPSMTWSFRTTRMTLVKDAENVAVQQQYLDGATNGERYCRPLPKRSQTETFGQQQRDKEGALNPIYVIPALEDRNSRFAALRNAVTDGETFW